MNLFQHWQHSLHMQSNDNSVFSSPTVLFLYHH